MNAYCRVADVAEDAELQEKSEADLQHLADLILTHCDQTMKEFEEKQKEEAEASPLADGNNGNALKIFDFNNISNNNDNTRNHDFGNNMLTL